MSNRKYGLPIGSPSKVGFKGKRHTPGLRTRTAKVFVATSAEGGTEILVQVASGKVSDKKPSFAR